MEEKAVAKKPVVDDSLFSLADIPLEALLNDDFLKGVPIVGTIKGAIKTISSMREYFFCKKIYLFLSQLDNCSEDEKRKFAEKFDSDKYSNKVGERLLYLIERLDDINKSSILGKAFKGYLKGTISNDILFRLCHAIDKVFLDDIGHLKHIEIGNLYDQTIAQSLYAAGFLAYTGTDFGNLDGGPVDGGFYYKLNEVGEALLEIMAENGESDD